jgi:hypothetical protein
MGLLDKKPGPEPKFTRGHHLGQYFSQEFLFAAKVAIFIHRQCRKKWGPSPEDLAKSGCKLDAKNKSLIIILCF